MSNEVFLLPDVGEGLIEAEIVAWKVNVGDVVILNQALVDVETAKAVVELPSPFAGTVLTLHGEVGDTMEVNQPLVTFEVAAGPASGADDNAGESDAAPGVTDEERREPVLIGYGVANEDGPVTRRGPRSTSSHGSRGAPPSEARGSGSVRTTPPVRLLAKQYGVDLTVVDATGRDGQVTREDVERARARSALAGRTAPTGPTTPSRFAGREIESWSTGEREERIAVKGVLKSMAEAMVLSSTQQPQAVVWLRADATRTVDLLRGLRAHPHFASLRLSPLTIAALAVCDAVRHYPGVNSSFDAERNEVIVRRYLNLGIAADTPRGLIVPNIKDADQLDLAGMAAALSTLVAAARDGSTTPQDLRGGTITVTNVGPFGVDAAMAILPPGTAAIVCVGQVAKTPWVVDDEIVVRHVVELSMTFDHRQVDGALASRVIAHIGHFLEDPAAALLAQ